jgi:hypothetical protein
MRTRVTAGFVLALILVASAAGPGFTQPKAKPAFAPAAKKYFPNWDKDKNGELSVEELDAVLTDPKVKGEAAAVAAVLRAAANPPKKGEQPPVLNLDFLAAPQETGKKSLDSRFAAALDRLAKADRKLFTADGPRLDTIHQGGMGDCFALAPLGALMNRDPKAVTKMMTPLADGRVKVAFFDRAVEVAPLTDGEIAMSGGSAEGAGCWVRVYEKALGQYFRDQKGGAGGKALASDAIAHGGQPGVVMSVLTGHATTHVQLAVFRDPAADAGKKGKALADLRAKLTAAAEGKRLATMSTPTEIAVPGMTPHHAHAVLGYDPKTDLVTIWNPHGSDFTPKGPDGPENGYRRKDGAFKAPLAEVAQWGRSFHFETDKPAPPPKK